MDQKIITTSDHFLSCKEQEIPLKTCRLLKLNIINVVDNNSSSKGTIDNKDTKNKHNIRHNTQIIRTSRSNSKSVWKKLLNDFATDQNIMDKLVNLFAEQLLSDQANLENNKSVSDCAICAPRVKSSIDCKYHIADKFSNCAKERFGVKCNRFFYSY